MTDMVLATEIQRLHKLMDGYRSIHAEYESISHYKVNQKMYDALKDIGMNHNDDIDIRYYEHANALAINGKPVFIDDNLSDDIEVYKHKDKPRSGLNLYSTGIKTPPLYAPINPIALPII